MKFRKDSIPHALRDIYNLLYKTYGARHWWPADNAFEITVGAILTQNTNWSNVEKAIFNLKKDKVLIPFRLYGIDLKRLAKLLRPCGYYNIKAARLKSFVAYIFSKYGGNFSKMLRRPITALRRELLAIKGIGPETADSIILYAAKKPVFVIDAYTRRIMACQGVAEPDSNYEDIQSTFMNNLPKSTKLFNEYHALLVEHAKKVCKTTPACHECILHSLKRT